MFANKIWIENEFKSIKNPAKITGTTNKYEGILNDNYDFKFQKKNFEAIKKSLEPFGIYPVEIYVAELVSKTTFVVTWSNPNILWQKYESKSFGSSQNQIFYKKTMYKTTEWLRLTPEEINNILNN